MSAAPEAFMHEPPDIREYDADRRKTRAPADRQPADTPEQKFWHWFAIGVLLFCWIAEATMCADRGF
jgi:hypothetical protein